MSIVAKICSLNALSLRPQRVAFFCFAPTNAQISSALSVGRGCVSTRGLKNPDAVAPIAATFSCALGRFVARVAQDIPSREGMDRAH